MEAATRRTAIGTNIAQRVQFSFSSSAAFTKPASQDNAGWTEERSKNWWPRVIRSQRGQWLSYVTWPWRKGKNEQQDGNSSTTQPKTNPNNQHNANQKSWEQPYNPTQQSMHLPAEARTHKDFRPAARHTTQWMEDLMAEHCRTT